MSDPIAKKVYYSIGEVCDLVGLKQHVLRYWETQFDILRPKKNKAGNRVFKAKDVEAVLLLKHLLYDERFTIEGARRRLKELRREGDLEAERNAVLEPGMLETLKADLRDLEETLTLPGS